MITLDLSTAPLGGTLNNYMDTLHADYAFIITPAPFVKSLQLPPAAQAVPEAGWDYTLYPNPARDALFLRFPDDAPKDIAVLDMAGRRVTSQANITGTNHFLPLGQLAKGAYWVRVTDGVHIKVKKLIIH
ncbi:MAG: T9SS type A sorting domain-containing protein [Flavobacteriales bacterium]|nr:T9SS type A sorting domain-containing protein [Flavobacteriales bacterium]